MAVGTGALGADDEGLAPGVLARALDYPYPRPDGSFVYDAGHDVVRPLDPAIADAWVAGRRPVLAIGSNAAPDQLRRKFATFPGDRRVVAVAAEVRGHDVVYAARVSAYGAVPATFVPCSGATVAVFALLLTPAQAAHLDETEGLGRAYDVAAVAASAVVIAGGAPLAAVVATGDTVGCYVAVRGPLRLGGAPVALAAVGATGRTWPAMTEPEVLARVAAAEGLGVEGFVRRALADAGFRSDVGARLGSGSW